MLKYRFTAVNIEGTHEFTEGARYEVRKIEIATCRVDEKFGRYQTEQDADKEATKLQHLYQASEAINRKLRGDE